MGFPEEELFVPKKGVGFPEARERRQPGPGDLQEHRHRMSKEHVASTGAGTRGLEHARLVIYH
jgi:hypothetical protein